jgi:phosphoglycolate phosphatase-like HAD superfamily hydrolase
MLSDIDGTLVASSSLLALPDIFATGLRKTTRTAEDAIALGGTPYDAEGAGKLGIATVGLTCRERKRSDLLTAGCVQVFRDPEHLLVEFDYSALPGD